MRYVIALALVVLPLASQAQTGTVSPGMNRAQVVTALGEPVTSRVASEYTYMFYRNDCAKECGMNDLVVLRGDSVVDAIFRSASRTYTGKSSSPDAIVYEPVRPRSARAARPARPTARPAAVAAAKPPATVAKPVAAATPAPAKAVAPAPAKPAAVPSKAVAPTPVKAAAPKPVAPAPAKTSAAPAPVRMTPGPPNDTRPSIPAGEPPLRQKPAPATPAKPPTP